MPTYDVRPNVIELAVIFFLSLYVFLNFLHEHVRAHEKTSGCEQTEISG